MPRTGKGKGRTELVRLEGIDAAVYWENQARFENAEGKLWEAQAELAAHLQATIRQLLQDHGPNLAAAVAEYNSAIGDIAMQLMEVRGGVQGEGSDAARDALDGLPDALCSHRVSLLSMQVKVNGVEFDNTGVLKTRSVDLTMNIPSFGDAHALDDRIQRHQRDTAWEVLAHLPVKVGPGLI